MAPEPLSPQYQRGLHDLATLPGVLGCALVETRSGMVIGFAGDRTWVHRAEASVDLWRIHQRSSDLRALGEPRAVVSINEKSRTTLTQCAPGIVLVSFSEEPDRTNWTDWKRHAGQLALGAREL